MDCIDPMDCMNSPGQNTGVGSLSLFQGISQPRDQTQVSHIVGGFFISWATSEAQEYWTGQPIPSPADLPNPGIELGSPALQADSLPTELSGKSPKDWYGSFKCSQIPSRPFKELGTRRVFRGPFLPEKQSPVKLWQRNSDTDTGVSGKVNFYSKLYNTGKYTPLCKWTSFTIQQVQVWSHHQEAGFCRVWNF